VHGRADVRGNGITGVTEEARVQGPRRHTPPSDLHDRAVLLVAGGEAGRWEDPYRIHSPEAEARYDEQLRGERPEAA
jgi:hypothetical protein